MTRFHWLTASGLRALGALCVVMAASCSGGSTVTQPSPAPSVSAVNLDAVSLPVGSTAQGTVTLSGNAVSGGTTVTLISSSPSVARVPSTVVVPDGATTATFAVSAMAAGSARVTATLGASSRTSQTLSVSPLVITLVSIALPTQTVVGGDTLTGVVTLSAPAPSGGVSVPFTSTDPLTVSPVVQVPAGLASAPFSVTTRLVGGRIVGTVSASYGGVTRSLEVAVTRPVVATAVFGVTGATSTDSCTVQPGGASLECTFDGTPSTAPGTITSWDWTWGVQTSKAQTTSGPELVNPSFDCSLLPPPPLPPGTSNLTLIVTLVVRDDDGHVSEKAVNNEVRLFPAGACGY